MLIKQDIQATTNIAELQNVVGDKLIGKLFLENLKKDFDPVSGFANIKNFFLDNFSVITPHVESVTQTVNAGDSVTLPNITINDLLGVTKDVPNIGQTVSAIGTINPD